MPVIGSLIELCALLDAIVTCNGSLIVPLFCCLFRSWKIIVNCYLLFHKPVVWGLFLLTPIENKFMVQFELFASSLGNFQGSRDCLSAPMWPRFYSARPGVIGVCRAPRVSLRVLPKKIVLNSNSIWDQRVTCLSVVRLSIVTLVKQRSFHTCKPLCCHPRYLSVWTDTTREYCSLYSSV